MPLPTPELVHGGAGNEPWLRSRSRAQAGDRQSPHGRSLGPWGLGAQLDIRRKVPRNLAEAGPDGRGSPIGRCNVTRPSSVRKAFASLPNAVVHAAATIRGRNRYSAPRWRRSGSSVIGTRTVLRASMKPAVRFVYLSSSEVLRKNPAVPWTETSDRVLGDPSLDRWSYSSSKGLCEHLVNAAHTVRAADRDRPPIQHLRGSPAARVRDPGHGASRPEPAWSRDLRGRAPDPLFHVHRRPPRGAPSLPRPDAAVGETFNFEPARADRPRGRSPGTRYLRLPARPDARRPARDVRQGV